MQTFAYGKTSEILSIRFSSKQSVDSYVQDNVVIDYDKDGSIVNLDIMNFSINEFKKAKPFQLFINKMRRARKEHLRGAVRPLSELATELSR